MTYTIRDVDGRRTLEFDIRDENPGSAVVIVRAWNGHPRNAECLQAYSLNRADFCELCALMSTHWKR